MKIPSIVFILSLVLGSFISASLTHANERAFSHSNHFRDRHEEITARIIEVRERFAERMVTARERIEERKLNVRERFCNRFVDRPQVPLPVVCRSTGDGGGDDDADDTSDDDTGDDNVSTVDHLIISEVLYDVAGDTQGSEISGRNEWVEIYNPTDTDVDLNGWEIGDSGSSDVIAEEELILGPGMFLLITNSTTTADHWDFTDVEVVYLESAIGGGLANGGDAVMLYDAGAILVDSVSYGSNETAFSPSVPTVSEGNTIVRDDLGVDTDTAADWVENDTPTPGS